MPYRSLVVEASQTIYGLIRELRPQQWYKQAILLVGILFSRHLFSLTAWGKVLVAIVAFTAIAGATYIFNDISDVEADRNHPEKRMRPIASGLVSIPIAVAFAVILLLFGCLIAVSLDPLFLIVLFGYFGQNMIYSLFLGDIVLVDVLIVAIGFVLRAIAGVVAIDVYLSPWLIICTFLLALVLAIGKRRHEFETLTDPASSRQSLGMYTTEELDQLLVVGMGLLLMAYTLYTFFRARSMMMLTLPFAFYGVFRYHYLIHTTDMAGRPEYLLTDRPTIVNLLIWTTIVIGVLYRLPQMLLEVLL
jgi:4-hydroxybenzoate polyprenyltransferase